MRLKPLIFFVLVALMPFLGTVAAQQRPQSIDDLFNPRPNAPPQQGEPAQRQRPDSVQQEPLPSPDAPPAKQTKAKKKKGDEQKQQDAQDQQGIRDIMAPPPKAETPAKKGKQQQALPDVQPEQGPTDQKISNATAVFSGLDKITGRIYPFEVAVKETVQFGALRVTPQACYTRPPTESQNTTGFVEVDEITLEGKIRRLFTGWMFATSPGLNAVEHPIYDVWLVDCKQGAPDVAKSAG